MNPEEVASSKSLAEGIRRYRLFYWLAGLLLVVGAIILPQSGRSGYLGIAFVAAGLVTSGIVSLRLFTLRCPRCGHRFFRRGGSWGLISSSECQSCGLRLVG